MSMNGICSRVSGPGAALATWALVFLVATGAVVAAPVSAPGQPSGAVSALAGTDAPTACTGDPGEPNDTFATAYVASCNLVYSAKICTNTDIDYYKMITTYGGSTLITMVPPTTRDYDLGIYDANQNIVCASIQGAGIPESCTVSMPAGSTFYIKVYGFQGAFSSTDFYTLSWSCISPTPPTVTTGSATSVERGRATLNLTVNPNGADTSVWTQFGTTVTYGSQTGTYGVGYGSAPVSVGTNASNLVCATTYHYQAVAQNVGGTRYGSDATFSTSPCIAPTVSTGSATDIETTRATLNLQVNPNSSETWVRVEYGPSTAYGAMTGEYGVGHGDGQFTQATNAPNLSCGTTYHYRALGRNTAGQSAVPGADATFTTLPCPPGAVPSVTTGAVSGVGPARATLRSTVNPKGSATSAWFNYGVTTGYGTTTPGLGVGSGNSDVSVRGGLRGLTCGMSYHARAGATNGSGPSTGGDAAFTTLACGGGVGAHGFTSFADVPGAQAQLYDVGVDSDGWLYVLAPAGAGLGVRRSTDGGASFGAAVTIASSGFTNYSYAMNVDPSDVIHVVWWGDGLATETYYSRSSDRGLTFSAPKNVRTGNVFNGYKAQNATYPVVASDGWGHVYVAFSGGTLTSGGAFVGYDVWIARSADGGATFQPEFHAYAPNASQDVPRRIVATPTGFYVVFVDESAWDLYLHRGDATAMLQNATRVNANPGRVLYNGDVAADDVGTTVHVAYSDTTTDSEGDVLYCKSLDGGATWQPCVRVNDSTYRWQESPRIVRDGYGTLHVAWADFRSNFRYQTYYASSTDGGTTFSANVNLSASQASNNFTQARLALDEAGRRLYVGASRDYNQIVWARGSSARNPPTVMTLPASAVTAMGATLNAGVNPNGSATTVKFQYGTTTSYGLETTAQDAGSGTTTTNVATPVSALVCGTLYHFRAVAENPAGRVEGEDLTFITTACPPAVTPQPASAVSNSNATLNASVNPNGFVTSVRFEYGPTTAYGTLTPIQELPAGNTWVPVSATVTGLTCATVYHFHALATNAGGPTSGNDGTFTTGPCPPSVTTQPATSVSATGATLNASVNPNGAATTVRFDYGTTASYGSSTPSQPAGAGTTSTPVATAVAGLACATTYHFQAVATNDGGSTPGGDQVFATGACPPTVTTDPATDITSSGATLNLSVNPRGNLTVVHFAYGTTASYGSNTLGQLAGSGTGVISLGESVTGLACATLHHFKAFGDSIGGPGEGEDRTFTTGVCPPTVTTQPATAIAMTTATLTASINPNGSAALVYFEYGATPAFGSVSLPQTIPAGTIAVPVSQSISALTCGTRYYFRAVGSNTGGVPVPGLPLTFDSARCPYKKGDLNLDLQTDLVLRNVTTGQNVAWLMNGITRLSEAAVTPDPVAPEWQIAGVDDFSGDGRNDLALWNSASGLVEFWVMNGTARVGEPVPLLGGSVLAPPWKLSATADFNHDDKPDLVWRNSSTQKIAIWTLDGTNVSGTLVPAPDQAADLNWEIVAALDFNADGNTDLLWYNWSSGKTVLWFMNASVQRVGGQFTNPPAANDANWKVLAAGDYGVGAGGVAGTNDIVWRNATSGKYVVWYMDNAGNRTFGTFTVPEAPANPLAWTVAGPR